MLTTIVCEFEKCMEMLRGEKFLIDAKQCKGNLTTHENGKNTQFSIYCIRYNNVLHNLFLYFLNYNWSRP